MAGSRYEYVKKFELPDSLLPSTFFIIRLDGKGFHQFSSKHGFLKPNDENALSLMNDCAKRVVGGRELNGECVLAFGESDEYSFVFKSTCQLHGRRKSKLVTLVTSIFSSTYVYLWSQYFPNSPLELSDLPVFDGRIVEYVTEHEIRDYMRWRQVDTHINNLYNTCFWTLVLKGGRTTQQANQELSGTISSQKQELLHQEFGMNYNNELAMFRKGSLVIWEEYDVVPEEEEEQASSNSADVSSTSNSPSTNSPADISDRPSTSDSISNSMNSLSIEPSTQPSPTTTTTSLSEPPKHMRQRNPKSKKNKKSRSKRRLIVVHEDFISDDWWERGRGKGVLQ